MRPSPLTYPRSACPLKELLTVAWNDLGPGLRANLTSAAAVWDPLLGVSCPISRFIPCRSSLSIFTDQSLCLSSVSLSLPLSLSFSFLLHSLHQNLYLLISISLPLSPSLPLSLHMINLGLGSACQIWLLSGFGQHWNPVPSRSS